MRALAVAALSLLVSAGSLAAQDAAELAAREAKLVAKAVPALHAVADALAAQRQHLRALDLRREIWLDYAEDDAKAREKCGFVKVGDLWRKDDSRLVLDRDMKPDAKAIKKVDQDLANLTKELLTEHRALAAGWGKLGDDGKALRHWQRVLRFAPGDKEASAAMALQPFEGFHGSPHEVAMLRRARTIRGACDWLRRTSFPTKDLGAGQLPLLAQAKVVHTGVRSEHFEVWGTLPPTELQTIAMDCERALLLARTLFGTWRGSSFVPRRLRNMVFLHDAGHYGAVLDQCADQFDAQRLQFLKNDVDQAFVETPTGSLRVHKAHLGLDASRDQAVRGVMQDVTGVFAEGLIEGIGHAACGFLFGRTLTFLVEQQKEQTMASWKPRALAPDLATWMQIAEESAWSKSDTRTSELVLLSAARFTAEQRVKAWAICHYLMHWRPELLGELDVSQTKDIRTPPDVEREFLRRTQVELPKVDHDWREFWARGGELRKAMAIEPIPDEKAPDRAGKLRARSLVDAVNGARAAAYSGPAGFFVAAGPDVAATQKYDEQLVRAESERKKKPKENIPSPVPPACLGRTVLWSRHKDPGEAVAAWLRNPVQRELVVHPGRELYGASLYAGAWLLDVAVAAVPTRQGPPLAWPRQGQREVAGSAPAAELGQRLAAALATAGKTTTDVVGMPLSLHFLRPMPAPVLAKIGCRVFVGTQGQPGVLVVLAGDDAGGESAEGCLAFVPLAPLPAGSEVEVQWELPAELLGKDETFPPIQFTVK